jgi:hypothetical protein
MTSSQKMCLPLQWHMAAAEAELHFPGSLPRETD